MKSNKEGEIRHRKTHTHTERKGGRADLSQVVCVCVPEVENSVDRSNACVRLCVCVCVQGKVGSIEAEPATTLHLKQTDYYFPQDILLAPII